MLTCNCSHQEYIVDGKEYMRMQFYVSGSKQKATAHLDLKKVSTILSIMYCNYIVILINYAEFQWQI